LGFCGDVVRVESPNCRIYSKRPAASMQPSAFAGPQTIHAALLRQPSRADPSNDG
jgi:hypothetical protein